MNQRVLQVEGQAALCHALSLSQLSASLGPECIFAANKYFCL